MSANIAESFAITDHDDTRNPACILLDTFTAAGATVPGTETGEEEAPLLPMGNPLRPLRGGIALIA
ncbi:MAG: hypothetical protein OK454_10370, partial [Thaumarchaeota archaeon]|nr:hypothetical protein [Nitrososphaerota archaeon]